MAFIGGVLGGIGPGVCRVNCDGQERVYWPLFGAESRTKYADTHLTIGATLSCIEYNPQVLRSGVPPVAIATFVVFPKAYTAH